MKTPMKSSALNKKLVQLDRPDIEDIRPDITPQVEAVCCGINSRVIAINNILSSMLSEKFDGSMLNKKGESALLEFLDKTEEHTHSNRNSFDEFQENYKQLLDAGCRVNSWAKACLKNANSATADAVKNFDKIREEIMGRFYDSLPSNVRLGKAPIFGRENSPDIGTYLSSVTS